MAPITPEQVFISKVFGTPAETEPLIELNSNKDTEQVITKVLTTLKPGLTANDRSVRVDPKELQTNYKVAVRIARYDLEGGSVSSQDVLTLLSRYAKLKFGAGYSAKQAWEDAVSYRFHRPAQPYLKTPKVGHQTPKVLSFNEAVAELITLSTGRRVSPNDPNILRAIKDGVISHVNFVGNWSNDEGLKLPPALYADILKNAGRFNEIKPLSSGDWDRHPALTFLNIVDYLNRLKQANHGHSCVKLDEQRKVENIQMCRIQTCRGSAEAVEK
jgi:hypothetical protein